MPKNTSLRLAVAQVHTLPTTAATLHALKDTAIAAAQQQVDLILFPEAYLGGYPRGATFGAAVGARDPSGREQFLQYFKDAVDLGDSPLGDGDLWVQGYGEGQARGDGVREELEEVAMETGVFLVVGLVEKAGGTLYCAVVYVDPLRGVIGKRRKVMPTGSERLIWGQGQPSSLRAVTTTIRDVKLTLAAAICWENYMPLLRYSLYSQNVNLYLTPTADARDTWVPLMRTVASEGRCFVLSSNQCIRKGSLPEWIHGGKKERTGLGNGSAAHPRATLRRASSSIITEDGHEIALPAGPNAAYGAGVLPGNLSTKHTHKRRKSIFTEDGHEICLPKSAVGEEEVDLEQTAEAGSTRIGVGALVVGNGPESSLPEIDNHKLDPTVLPPVPESKIDRSRRMSVFTEIGHEIALPANGAATTWGTFSQPEAPTTEFVCRGGSCIISPLGEVLAGPSWENEDDLLVVDVDFDDCLRGRLDLDVAGSYSRNDAFKLTVEGLDLSPPV